MVCLRDARTHTGLTGPFTDGKRSGLVDGIEVIEFDLPYSNHAGLLGAGSGVSPLQLEQPAAGASF